MFLSFHRLHILSLLCAAGAALCFATSAAAQSVERQRINIHSGWTFRLAPDSAEHHVAKPVVDDKTRSAASAWLPAEVPGVVQTDLLRNGIIPDPFYRDNESRLQWIGLEDWEYRTTVQVDQAMLARKHVELVFDGLDTYADVFLNDHPVLHADNMFRQWRVNVAPHLTAGANTLRIVFRSPVQQVLKQIKDTPVKLPTVGQVLIVSELGIPTDPYTRKAPYHYGWDWGPRFVTEGIWRAVRLETWDTAVIRDLHVQQHEVTATIANLSAQAEVEADRDGPATVTIDYGATDKTAQKNTIERQVVLHAGTNRVEIPIQIANPARWFPTGYGAQNLYRFEATLRFNNAAADRAAVRTGLRSIELRREPDQWGKSFEFVVNGIPVFGKGANVIPFDSFPNRVTPERYRSILADARAANMNMVRAWGGGYYENDEFYDACDELGILVWQDFMFGGAVQPGDPAFLESVRQEAIDNVKRLRDHPSIVLWCGNNEQEAAWVWWGDRRAWKASLTPEVRERVWQDYLLLFKGVLQTVVAEYARPVEYWSSSPSADFEALPGTPGNGDMHYWDVWHARAPLEDYEKQFPRFMSEYGFQSFPEMKTIEAFSVPADWAIESPVMLAHQKNVGGNARIHDYMLKYYAEPRDFASFLYVSQVLQAEGIRIGAEHLRRQRPRTMGSLYWQLNDCWPVASWASLDYYGRWKALHYFARRFYNDLLISPDEADGAVSVYVVSDRVSATPAKVRVRLMDFSGRVLTEKTQDAAIPALSSAVYLRVPTAELLQGRQPGAVFLSTDLFVDGAPVSRNVHFFARMKDVVLPAAQIKTMLDGSGPDYRLRLESAALARNVYVSFGSIDATVSDNYFELMPGEPLEIRVRTAAPLEQLRKGMKVTSLVDAFAKPR